MKGRNEAMIRRFFPGYEPPRRAYESALNRCVKPGSYWLDVGCGRALSSDPALNEELTKRAGLVVGCDVDPHALRDAAVRDLTLCDAGSLPFADDTFDVVTMSMVAEHLGEPEKVFAEISRVSRENGTLVVFTPNKWNCAMLVARATPDAFHLAYKRLIDFLSRGERESLQGDDVFPTYYRSNTVGRLRRLMVAAGFEDVRIERHGLAHSFGFVRPLYALSLLFERVIDRWPLDTLKAEILAIGVKRPAVHTANPVRTLAAARLLQERGVAVAEAVSAHDGRRAAAGGGH